MNQTDSPEVFRSVRGQLLFIAHSSRPEVAYSVAQICQVPYLKVLAKDTQVMNETARYHKSTAKLTIQYPVLYKQNRSLYLFIDAGYNTNDEGKSQLGFIIFLVDRYNMSHFLHWSSAKCSRITNSMITGESHAFSQRFDYGISLNLLFKKM